MAPSVGNQMARTMGLFQALVALPVMLVMGSIAMESIFQSRIPLYDFIGSAFIALFAACIIFTIFVQRNVKMSKKITLYFEAAKSGFATAVWLWLLLDTIFVAGHPYWFYYSGPRGARILRVVISIILLFILYYPTLIYAAVERRREAIITAEDSGAAGERQHGERQPLLG